jgi:hypothetical protein
MLLVSTLIGAEGFFVKSTALICILEKHKDRFGQGLEKRPELVSSCPRIGLKWQSAKLFNFDGRETKFFNHFTLYEINAVAGEWIFF